MRIMITKDKYGWHFSLEHAEVGDVLMVSRGSYEPDYEVVAITKVTKTQVTTSDGNVWMIGSHRRVGSSDWDRKSLCMYDENAIKESKARKLRRKLADEKLYAKVPLETLERILEMIEEAPATKDEEGPEE